VTSSLPATIDWFRVLADLRGEGIPLDSVSFFTGIPRTSLAFYRDGGEPPFWRGSILLRFWQETMQRDDPPMVPVYPRIVAHK